MSLILAVALSPVTPGSGAAVSHPEY